MLKLKILALFMLALIVFPMGMAQGARLQATPAATEAASGSAKYLVNVSTSKDLGKYLVGEKGMTLYIFTIDPLNDSTCYDQCAKAWPPLTVKNASDVTAEEEIPGKFGTITRKDGSLQVTYN